MVKVLRHVFVSVSLLIGCGASAQSDLEQAFLNPPDSARPHTWWHWMNGNISREGITADLEAMKRVGIGGVQVFDVRCDIPHGPVQVLGPGWYDLMKFALAEGQRLGLQMCVHNCPGWSNSGGPWVRPEHAMQVVTTSEIVVQGPGKLSVQLPNPPVREGFYGDIAVLAYPALPGDDLTEMDPKPVVSGSARLSAPGLLVDKDLETSIELPLPARNKPAYVQLEFPQPFEAQSITISLPSGKQSHQAELQVSADGKSFRKVRDLVIANPGRGRAWQTDAFPATRSRFFRVVVSKSKTRGNTLALAEISLGRRRQVDRIQVKGGFIHELDLDPDLESAAPRELTIDPDRIIDLTGKVDSSGKLVWDAPEGRWTVLRFGRTLTVQKNYPAPPEATGLEVDKCSREAVDEYWEGHMARLVREAGHSLDQVLIDSYEVGSQNWTPLLRQEFKRRRGYDPLPFMPALTGRVIDSTEVTERFLWDYRRTLADLYADNYFGRFRELCHKKGLKLAAEPYGNGNFESFQSGARADLVMGEFWTSGGYLDSLKLAASIVHTRGLGVVGAESFTASEKADGWRLDPQAIKAIGDLAFCKGVNRYIFHRYAHQPWMDKSPGMSMGPYGTHFDRTQTWWEQGAEWMRYVARCQALLQAGQFVADLCYFTGENAPAGMPSSVDLKPAVPAGYDYDVCDVETLSQFKVRDGQLVLPSGMSYRVLVLRDSPFMTPRAARIVHNLVKSGATVVGPRPVRSPSLADFPACDKEIAAIAAEVWGDCDGLRVKEHVFGKGRVMHGKSLVDVFSAMNVPPDCQEIPDVQWIHRRTPEADIFFVSNQRPAAQQISAVFRMSGKQPELWRPDSGKMECASVWSEREGRTTVPLYLEAEASVFVVFRQAPMDNRLVRLETGPQREAPVPDIEIVKAVYEAIDGTQGKDVTAKVRQLVGNRTFAITADNMTFGDAAPLRPKRLTIEYVLEGRPMRKRVDERQVIELVRTSELPPPQVVADEKGFYLETFGPASVQGTTASGQSLSAEVTAVAAPQALAGPWTLHFPEGWGAPEVVKLSELVPWNEHDDPGVRYFSGSAEYETQFEVPEETLRSHRQHWLDLGIVKNFAQVSMNGHSFPTLWKPPFRLDVTSRLRPGTNRLRVKVTNLWPNRLIGDENYPDDREWAGAKLKAWPEWFQKGQPRPETNRLTFTTWRYYDRDFPLLESGLIGPVRLLNRERRLLQ